MLVSASHRSPRLRLLGVAIAIAVLAGCAGNSSVIPNQGPLASSVPMGLGLDEIVPGVTAPPKCTGQKDTLQYAKSAVQHLKRAGGSLCIPEFGGWGGALQYPQQYGSTQYTVVLISSTKAYKGGLFPPAGSHPAIYYLQIAFDGFPGFYPALPKGNPMVSSHLAPGKTYTAELWLYLYHLGWSELSACYQVAKPSKYGGSFADVGALFTKETFLEKNAAIEIFKGNLGGNQC
jgi:hypothetical protein